MDFETFKMKLDSIDVDKMVVTCTPIVDLSKATNAVSEGNYEVFVQNSSQDEIGDLARSSNIMVPQLKERIDMQKTLEIAKQIQQC